MEKLEKSTAPTTAIGSLLERILPNAPRPTPSGLPELRKRIAMDPEKARRFRRNVLQFDEPTPAHERIGKWAQDYSFRVYNTLHGDESLWLVMVGGTGTGKSHLARGIARFISLSAVDLWHSGRWQKVPTVSVFAWSELMDKDASGAFQEAGEASLLVVDDIGAEVDRYKSGQPCEVLRRLMESREGRWTIWTTNIPQNLWRERWDERVASRLKEAKTLVFDGIPDFRMKKTTTTV